MEVRGTQTGSGVSPPRASDEELKNRDPGLQSLEG